MILSAFIDKYRKMFMSFATTEVVRSHSRKIRGEVRESILRQNILYSSEPGTCDTAYCTEPVIVSLTTFGPRIQWVGPAIESIMEQTVKANRIILWLGHEFERPHMIPRDLRMLQDRGLEIMFTDDYGPATKLLPALRAFPDCSIITIDDDTIYSYDLIDKLIRGHLRFPKAVITDYFDSIAFNGKGELTYILNGPKNNPAIPDEPTMQPVALGVTGVLYPPDAMHPDVTDTGLFQQLAPKADDLWFKTQQLRAGTPVYCVGDTCPSFERLISIEHHDPSLSLFRYNLMQGGNDRQLRTLFDYYSAEDLARYYR